MPNGSPPAKQIRSEPHRLHIAGMTAVVTGGAGGIGKGIVKALLRRGARVVVADIEQPVLGQAVEDLSPLGPVEGVPTDVSDERSVTALADHVFETHGGCNLLFANAGVTSGGGGKPRHYQLRPTGHLAGSAHGSLGHGASCRLWAAGSAYWSGGMAPGLRAAGRPILRS